MPVPAKTPGGSYTAPGYPTLNYSQLKALWIQAGGNAKLAPIMAAIALAESGGRAGATNPIDNSGAQTSWGLWQISTGNHNSPAGAGHDVYDPLTNARLAVGKYKSQGLTAWGTYTSGAYKSHLNGANPIPPGSLGQGEGPNSPIGQIEDLTGIAGDRPGTVGCYLSLPGFLGGFCLDVIVFGIVALAGAGVMLVGVALIAKGTGVSTPRPFTMIATRTRAATGDAIPAPETAPANESESA